MNLLRRCLAAIVRWAIADELGDYNECFVTTKRLVRESVAINTQISKLRDTAFQQGEKVYKLEALHDQVKAIQALDIGYQERGKIVVCAHVGNQDIVKIIDMPASMSHHKWRQMVEHIEIAYGAKAAFVDAPRGVRL